MANSKLNIATKLEIPYWFQTMKLNTCDGVSRSSRSTLAPPQTNPTSM